MTETKHGVDESFNDRLNILRAAVLGANDGIISIAGVVIGVASATPNVWIIFLSGLSAILAGAFSMAGGEYVSVSTQKDTEEAAVNREQALLDRDPKLARESLYHAYLQNGECETSAKILTERAFLKHPLKALVEEKYGIEYEEFTNPWHAAASSFLAFSVGSLPPMLSLILFPTAYRNLSYRNMLELESKELSEEVSHTHGEKANDQVAKHGLFGWGFSQFRTGITSEDQG